MKYSTVCREIITMSNYAQRMSRLSARIFGDVARPTDQQSMKVVKIFTGMPAHLNPEIVKWYPRHKELKMLMSGLRYHGLYRDEHEDFKEEMQRRRELKGKTKWIPPPYRERSK